MPESACLNCRLLLSFISILMLLISITLKINQTWWHVSWFLIFLPVWIFNAVSLSIIIYLIIAKKWLGNRKHAWKILSYSLSLISSCLFEVFLCVKLQLQPTLPYWVVFSPLWIFMFLILNLIAQHMYRTCQLTADKAM